MLLVDKNVGSMIDWYNVQFYNQGTTEYTDCNGLLTQSSTAWPQTSLFEIAASGVSLDKLVIGKPGTASDATNGYIDPATLATCVATAKAQNWDAGVMVWQVSDPLPYLRLWILISSFSSLMPQPLGSRLFVATPGLYQPPPTPQLNL